jgi:PPK2 family polyphosphate:nucleotide phosphotransferase
MGPAGPVTPIRALRARSDPPYRGRMKTSRSVRRISRFLEPYRITRGGKFRLRDHDPGDTGGLGSADKPEAKRLLASGVERMATLQERLYAANEWGVLLIFQAMDAAGKDGTIKHVLSGVNPQGCQVHSFKQPSAEELDHDFLWRTQRAAPERGRIGIFNRSYYEEVLVVRVHPQILARQRIPARLVGKGVWDERLEDIAAYERYLARNGFPILKFFLNVSRQEQKRRFLERLDEPDKHWKFSAADVRERVHWKAYMKAYEEAIQATATEHAPWYVVPADQKWFTRLVVAAAIVETLEGLDLAFPRVPDATREELALARAQLARE